MDLDDIEQRYSDLVSNLDKMIGIDVETGQMAIDPVMQADLEALRAATADLIARDGETGAVKMMREMLDILAQTYADVTSLRAGGGLAPPVNDDPPLFDAIESGDLDGVREALKTCDVNVQYGTYAASALYRALSGFEDKALEIAHTLLDAGADPKRGLGDSNVLHGLGFPVWRNTTPEDLFAVVKRCIDGGADIEQRTEHLKWTPLILAVSEWNDVATEALLLAGADPFVRASVTGRGCFSGADVLDFANGHAKTSEVLKGFRARH